MFHFNSTYTDISLFPLNSYDLDLPFSRLKLGVDNVRYDVLISPEFRKTTGLITFELILKYADAPRPFTINTDFNWFKEIAVFKRLCTQILTDGIDKAKSAREIQIDFLTQTAVVKMLTEEIHLQYEQVIQHCKTVIRKQEILNRMEVTMRLREELSGIIQRKNRILQKVGAELFQYFIEVQHEVSELRTSNFGDAARLPEELFSNPILQATSTPDGFFLIENYVLLGHRIEDPVNYHALINLFSRFLEHLSTSQASADPVQPMAMPRHAPEGMGHMVNPVHARVDGWIKHVDNVDKLFNFYHTLDIYKKLKKRHSDKHKIQTLKNRYKFQKQMLNLFFRNIVRENMIDGIVAAYKIESIYHRYCPPLSPQECLQYLVLPKARKNTIRKLQRFKKYYGKSFPLNPLRKTIKQVKSSPRYTQKRYLVRFLKDFARYHRDIRNFHLIREACDCINLVTDERVIKLSSENHTLYEFVLSHESSKDKQPIIHHVVIKADIRGSSDIVERMKARNMNPASNFSLNFFDPVSKILSQYGAVKIFIEGDAVILAIFEYEGMAGKWYSVARSCGLAINILMIVKKYNRKNRINNLPSLDLGIGIGYAGKPPTFFYDSDNQIMISPAINVADQLSGCNKSLREQFQQRPPPFNVYVYKPARATANIPFSSDFPLIRYNVQGVELAPEGFEKLRKEIHLKRIEGEIPEIGPERLILYTGKFPTNAGNYQRIVIREAPIPEVAPDDLRVLRHTDEYYYEVCTNPRVYDLVKSGG